MRTIRAAALGVLIGATVGLLSHCVPRAGAQDVTILRPTLPACHTDDGRCHSSECYAITDGCNAAERDYQEARRAAIVKDNPPLTDEEHAANIRAAYRVYWKELDESRAAEKTVNDVSEWARAAGLTVGHDEAKCGPNRDREKTNSERMRCLGIYRLTRTDLP